MTRQTYRRAHNGLGAERDFGREHVEKKKNENRNDAKKEGEKTDLQTSYLRQRGYGKETALRGLCGMGFKDGEVRRALGIVEERWAGSDLPIETVLREALSVLT